MAPIIAAGFYAAWERQVKHGAGVGHGCSDVTKARAKRPRERKWDEVHLFFPALTDRANLWVQTGDMADRLDRGHS